MTQAKILKLVASWQEFLGLSQWDIAVDFDTPTGEEANAHIFRFNQYDKAILYLNQDWKSWNLRHTNELIAHEMLHLLARDLEQAWQSVDNHVTDEVFMALDDRFVHELEGLVDRLALKLVELANS